MGWVYGKSFWLVCPYVADGLEGREALEGFEPPPIIIGVVDEVVQVGVELPRALVMRACDGGILDRPVQAFHLAIGPGMLDLGASVLNPVFWAAQVEQMGDVRGGRAIRVARRKRELDAVVRQHGVDGVGNRGDQRDQEGGGCAPVRVAHKLDEDERAGAVDRHRQGQLAFCRSDLDDVDMNVADGVGLEWLLWWLVSRHVRQSAAPVALQARMRGAGTGSWRARRRGRHPGAAMSVDGRRR